MDADTATTTPIAVCRCCGAALRVEAPGRLDDIKGREHVKRAIEVAAVGAHPIALLSEGTTDDMRQIAEVARSSFGLTVYPLTPCRCGNHGSARHTCTCTPKQVAQHKTTAQWRLARARAELWVLVTPVAAEALLSTRRGEPDERVRARIAAAQAVATPTALDGAAQRLMVAALRQLQFSQTQHDRAIAIASSVARLAGATTIGPVHLAEAIQYHDRS